MKKWFRVLVPALALSGPAFAGMGVEEFYIDAGETSVVLRRICIPQFDEPQAKATVVFNTTNLTVTIRAVSLTVEATAFVYTGGNIDDYDGTPPAWGNPAASAVELEDIADGCFNLHIRDEVMAVADADMWTVDFSDSTTDAIMDWTVTIYDAITLGEIQGANDAAMQAYGGSGLIDEDEFNARTTPDPATATLQGTISAAVDGLSTTISAFIDALTIDLAAIKAKTDELTFTEPNEVDVNAKSFDDVETCITAGGAVSTVLSGNCP